jgi:hypothetical protein
MPFRIKPDFGQVSENGSESSSSESWDVFDDHPSGPNCANDPSKIVPKTGPFACESCSLASDADVLAWESAADEVNAVVSGWGECANVAVFRNVWPVLPEDCGCIRVYLHLPLTLHPGPL